MLFRVRGVLISMVSLYCRGVPLCILYNITAGVSEITEVFGGDHQLRDVPQDTRPAQIRQI